MDDTYVALLAAFAVGGGANPDEAWDFAREVAAEIPEDLPAASEVVVMRARQAVHPL